MAAKNPAKPKTQRRGRPSTAEAALLESRLLDAAQVAFLEHGYARTTMDAIAKAAAATRKTLYARYANKDEVFAAVIARMLEATALEPDPATYLRRTNMRTLLLKLANELIAIVEAPRTASLSRLIYAEAYEAPELVRLSEEVYARALTRVMEALKVLRATGQAPTLPPDEIAGPLFMEMVVSTPRSRAILGANLPRQQVVLRTEAAVDLFLRGCGFPL